MRERLAAEQALERYWLVNSEVADQEAMVAALTDLMHWADSMGISYHLAALMAQGRYNEEAA